MLAGYGGGRTLNIEGLHRRKKKDKTEDTVLAKGMGDHGDSGGPVLFQKKAKTEPGVVAVLKGKSGSEPMDANVRIVPMVTKTMQKLKLMMGANAGSPGGVGIMLMPPIPVRVRADKDRIRITKPASDRAIAIPSINHPERPKKSEDWEVWEIPFRTYDGYDPKKNGKEKDGKFWYYGVKGKSGFNQLLMFQKIGAGGYPIRSWKRMDLAQLISKGQVKVNGKKIGVFGAHVDDGYGADYGLWILSWNIRSVVFSCVWK